MKIVIWTGCRVIAEHNHPELTGPDIHIDPDGDLIGASRDGYHETPIPYHQGFRGTLPVPARRSDPDMHNYVYMGGRKSIQPSLLHRILSILVRLKRG